MPGPHEADAPDHRARTPPGRSEVVGELEIRERAEGGRHTLALVGELDIATAGALGEAVLRACDGGAQEVVLDLRDLAFIDSTGFRAILAGKRRCEESGSSFFMTRGQEPVQRLFEVSGVLRKLPFIGDASAGGHADD